MKKAKLILTLSVLVLVVVASAVMTHQPRIETAKPLVSASGVKLVPVATTSLSVQVPLLETDSALATLADRVSGFSNLTDEGLKLKIAETDQQIQESGLIVKANHERLTSDEASRLRNLLRDYHALVIVRMERIQS